MSKIYKKIDDLLENDVVDRHSFFQLKYFVIGKEPTTQAKLWRCIKELKSRKESLDAINLEIEELNDKISLLEMSIEEYKPIRSTKELEDLSESQPEVYMANIGLIKKNEIKGRQLGRQKKSMIDSLKTLEHKLKNTEEEAIFFLQAYESLAKIEKLKPFDDEASQLDYWSEKLGQELNMKLLLNRPLDVELVKTILSLKDDAPIKVKTIHMLEKVQQEALEAKKQKQALEEK